MTERNETPTERREERRFPLLQSGGLTIPWSVAERAYEGYVRRHGTSQTLDRMAERGGFAASEMDEFYPAWRHAMSHEPIPFDTVRKRVNRPMAAENRRPVPAWGREPNGTLWIRCTCGLPITLDVPDTHTVAPDGTVSPSVWHDDCPTGWHTFVRLENWSKDK